MSDPNLNPDPPAPPAPDLVSLTKAELDALINGRVGQAIAQAEKKYKAAPIAPEIQKELDDARTFKADLERKELERKGEYEKALSAQSKSIRDEYEPKLKERDELVSKRDTRLRREVVTNRLLSAAADGNAVNAAQVVSLLESRVKLDDEFEPQVVDEQGNPRFVGDKAMSPAQLVEEFLRSNPHFVKASGGKAGGATGGATTKGSGDVGVIAELEKQLEAVAEEARRNTGNLSLLVKHSRMTKELAELKSKSA